VFDRIVMDIIHMSAPIRFIPDKVFPKPALPHRGFAAAVDRCNRCAGYEVFDQAPAGGEISVILGQLPDAVQMVRQDDDGIDGERSFGHYPAECISQAVDGSGVRKDRAPVVGDHGEEEASAMGGGSAVVAHWMLPFGVLVDPVRLI